MIIDKIENLWLYEKLNPRFAKAFAYLEETDFNQLDSGKYTIEGNDVFALLQEYETKSAADCMLEGHQKYIDIQYVLNGEEIMGMTSFANQKVLKPYHTDNDIAFYDGEYSTVKVAKGNFTIFFPGDLHMPCLKVNAPARVKRLLLKSELCD
ncbi:MAG TPA: YhcH/YjgK/YiaL family protein [Cyclobacteriaceae bacterium]